MKIVKALKEFTFKGIYYEKNDDVKVETLEELVKLNEKGFITPQILKDYQNFGKEDKSKKIDLKKEE